MSNIYKKFQWLPMNKPYKSKDGIYTILGETPIIFASTTDEKGEERIGMFPPIADWNKDFKFLYNGTLLQN